MPRRRRTAGLRSGPDRKGFVTTESSVLRQHTEIEHFPRTGALKPPVLT